MEGFAGSGNTGFREVQRFRQPLLWITLVLMAVIQLGVFGWGLVTQLILGVPWGDRPLPDAGLAAVALFAIGTSLGLVVLLYCSRLETEVRSDGIHFRFHPFHLSERHLSFSEVRRWEAVTYRPVLEYGGWGLRMGLRGPAYNVSGNQGVRMFLTNGTEILFGSQRPGEMVRALDAARAARDLAAGELSDEA